MHHRNFFLLIESFLFFLILNPFFLLIAGSPFDSYDLQRLTQLLLLLVASIHLFCDKPLRAYAMQYFEGWLSYRKVFLGLILLLGLISAACAIYTLFAFMQVATFFLLFLFALMVAGLSACLQERFIKWVFNFIFISFGISALRAIGLFFMRDASAGLTLDPNAFINLVTAPCYMNRRFFDDAVMFAIPLLCGFFFITPSRWKKVLVFCLLSFLFARGILGGSRLYFYEPLALLILLPICFRKRAIPYLWVLALSLASGFLLYEVMYHSIFNIQLVADGQFSFIDPNHRLLLWQLAISMIKAHPWLGVGPLHYPVYAFAAESYAAHPHDFILAFASEWGIPATLLILLLAGFAYFALLHKAFIHRKSHKIPLKQSVKTKHILNESIVAMSLIGALTGAGLMALVDGLILMPVGQLMLTLTAGLAIAWHRDVINPELLQLSSKCFNVDLFDLSVIAWAVIAYAVLPIAMLLPDFVAQYLSSCHFVCTLSPNYWSQGFIQFYT